MPASSASTSRASPALRGNLAVDEQEREPAILPADRLRDHGFADERRRLLREVEALHLDRST